MVINRLLQKYSGLQGWLGRNKLKLIVIAVMAAFIFALIKPKSFANLWLTADQQGQLLFELGYYPLASTTFNNVKWQAYSAYGAELFEQSALYYGQFDDIDSVMAKANALAHAKHYLKARDIYQSLIEHQPDYQPAITNLKIVQDIIDSINLMSASQQPESGDGQKELGDDEPRRAEGADKMVWKTLEVEQLTSEQLLLDPSLNEMWMRQVQKDPGHFLSQKFYMQQQALDYQGQSIEGEAGD